MQEELAAKAHEVAQLVSERDRIDVRLRELLGFPKEDVASVHGVDFSFKAAVPTPPQKQKGQGSRGRGGSRKVIIRVVRPKR